MSSAYEKLGAEIERLRSIGEAPQWMDTNSYQMLHQNYLLPGETPRDLYKRNALAAGRAAAKLYGEGGNWSVRFLDIMWKGWFCPSTPAMANLGTERGMPISCSSLFVSDSVDSFYTSLHEGAVLSKNGFGTAAYLGDIRPRGSEISRGGKASGLLPVMRNFTNMAQDVSQGGIRRGSVALYIPADHGDFDEIADFALNHPDGLNLGWNISDEFTARMNSGDREAIGRYQKILKLRRVAGKGYLFFPDKANRLAPECLRVNAPKIVASNLCSEAILPSDADHTFLCALSSMNVEKFDEWKNTDAVFLATVFLDSLVEIFLGQAQGQRGFERIIRFTEKSRAIGLGTMGFHSYLQRKGVAFESLKANAINNEVYAHIQREAEKATEWMAKIAGEPEWCIGFNRRNATLTMVAPNMSTAVICGGTSQGIEPVVANVYTQGGQAGDMSRINPVLLDVMQSRGVYSPKIVAEIREQVGSVQDVDWLSDQEKMVFRTAFEIDQSAIVRLASNRQKFIDQGQSLNLFFSSEEEPQRISAVHRQAIEDPNIKSLYYLRSARGVRASADCVACAD